MRRHPRINLSGECSTLSIYNTCYDRGIMLGMHPGPPTLLEWGCLLLLLLLPSSSPAPFHFSPNHQSLFLAGKRSTPIIPRLHRLEMERPRDSTTSPPVYRSLAPVAPSPVCLDMGDHLSEFNLGRRTWGNGNRIFTWDNRHENSTASTDPWSQKSLKESVPFMG